MGTTYILAAALAFTGVLPFSVLTSVIVAYGMAGEMVKLAETNMMSEWGMWALPRGRVLVHTPEVLSHTPVAGCAEMQPHSLRTEPGGCGPAAERLRGCSLPNRPATVARRAPADSCAPAGLPMGATHARRCPPPCTDPDGLKTLKFLATKWHIAFSAMTVLGLLLSTLM